MQTTLNPKINLEKQKQVEIRKSNELEKELKEEEFKKKYRYGSTKVIFFEKQFFFIGDISHCGKPAIYHNAQKIRKEMISLQETYGSMSYDNLPIFRKRTGSDFEDFKKEAIESKHTIWLMDKLCYTVFENHTDDGMPEKQTYFLNKELYYDSRRCQK